MGVKVDDNFTGGNGQKAEEREPDSGGDAGQQQKRPKSASTLLVELALDRYEFGCTEDGKPFAVRPGGHVVRMLRGGKNSLRAELSQAYYWRYRKAPPQQALADALLVLDGEATSRTPKQCVPARRGRERRHLARSWRRRRDGGQDRRDRLAARHHRRPGPFRTYGADRNHADTTARRQPRHAVAPPQRRRA
jgi:hypothetical protein